MGKYIDYYCKDNCKELKRITDKILNRNFGWVPQMNYDDFYSIAGEVLWRCNMKYDESKGTKFRTYLIDCLSKKFKTRITYCNRNKRKMKDENGDPISEISMSKIINDETGTDVEHALIEQSDLIEDFLSKQGGFREDIQSYLLKLTKKQKKIAILIMKGYTPLEVREILGISAQKYQEQWQKMTSYEKIAILDKER